MTIPFTQPKFSPNSTKIETFQNRSKGGGNAMVVLGGENEISRFILIEQLWPCSIIQK